MNEKQTQYKRRFDLSSKLLQMGKALMDEGYENNQMAVIQTGSFLILIGGVILEDEDVETFAKLCSMFSAKKLLDSMENNHLFDINTLSNNETIDGLLKKLKKMEDDADDLDKYDNSDEEN